MNPLRAAAVCLFTVVMYSSSACAQTQTRPLRNWHAAVWADVVACAGDISDPTTTFEQINWIERDTADAKQPDGTLFLGQWVPPDTIYILKGYADTAWVVAHEMLHHRIGVYNDFHTVHPWIPFAFPCKLMPFQQGRGGIMRSRT